MSHRKASRDRRSVRRLVPLTILSALVLLLSGCGVRVWSPAGPAAAAIAELWWVMFGLSLVVFAGVIAALVFALRRPRGEEAPADQLGRRLVAIGGVIVPGVIVVGLMVYNTYITVGLEEPPSAPVATIEVSSYQWWWDVRYPEQDFSTANEIHIPVGQPVTIRLQSDDVIHSFWVPELHGKRDMMPEHVGSIWLQADEPGVYRGQCAEFCGLQHAKMQFLVIAHEPDAFEAWLEQQQAPRPELEDEAALRGQELFLDYGCGNCHAVRETEATGTIGPDLTNLASRRELGAGTLPNTRDNLAAWVVDAQQFKPGNRMPRIPVPDQDLQDVLAYLETLE